MQLPKKITLPLDKITPYPHNPRRITEEAIEAVRTSIERYGYVQPIVVDTDHVIIVGHTRLEALKRLEWKKAEVYVSDMPAEKAREYRLVDNRVGEMTGWDHEALVLELREFEQNLLDQFFPNIDLEISMIDDAQVTAEELEWTERSVKKVQEAAPVPLTDVVCPSCFHTFQVRTQSLPGVTGADVKALSQ